MSDLVGNPEDRFSQNEAHLESFMLVCTNEPHDSEPSPTHAFVIQYFLGSITKNKETDFDDFFSNEKIWYNNVT